jgi:hypothetical protein
VSVIARGEVGVIEMNEVSVIARNEVSVIEMNEVSVIASEAKQSHKEKDIATPIGFVMTM